MRFFDAAVITILPVLVPAFTVEMTKLPGAPTIHDVRLKQIMAADVSSKQPTHAELTAFLKEELPDMSAEPFDIQNQTRWKFTKNLVVVKIFDLSIDKGTNPEITFKCKITDSVKTVAGDTVNATCYIGIHMKQIDPEDPQSWCLLHITHLKVREVKEVKKGK